MVHGASRRLFVITAVFACSIFLLVVGGLRLWRLEREQANVIEMHKAIVQRPMSDLLERRTLLLPVTLPEKAEWDRLRARWGNDVRLLVFHLYKRGDEVFSCSLNGIEVSISQDGREYALKPRKGIVFPLVDSARHSIRFETICALESEVFSGDVTFRIKLPDADSTFIDSRGDLVVAHHLGNNLIVTWPYRAPAIVRAAALIGAGIVLAFIGLLITLKHGPNRGGPGPTGDGDLRVASG